MEKLPSKQNLFRSTLIAFVTASVLLVTTILPAEYGYDPTGFGKTLGLTEMGEIKRQLAIEAEKDRVKPIEKKSSLMLFLAQFSPMSSAFAQTPVKTDTISFTLQPNEGIEYKMVMKAGAKASFSWTSEIIVNYDMHGEKDEKSAAHSYKKGRGVSKDEGQLEAAFEGTHGWFWRNRGTKPSLISLTVKGDYSALIKI
jgi:hypothetical protein